MLVELRCEQLIKKAINFDSGLNVLVGADDGTNSIGKSSVLMLIDFAFAGDDFMKLCADVIKNIGIITIEVDFKFDNVKYSFSRSTNDPKIVHFLNEPSPEKSIEDYRSFLQNKYKFPQTATSFRGAVNTFFRIWGKDNYNPNKPLNSFPNEPYAKIKPNLLKLFSLYDEVKLLEKEKQSTESKKNILNGAFRVGYIKEIKQSELKKSEKRLQEIENEINEIKKSIEAYSINADQIINEHHLKLKSKKDELSKSLFQLKNRLTRVEDNLTYGSQFNQKQFEKLKDFFPSVNTFKMAQIEQFHSGVTKILKSELRNEKELLTEQILTLESSISDIDYQITESLGVLKKPAGLLDRILDLSVEGKSLREQIQFKAIKKTITTRTNDLTKQISDAIASSLSGIEKTLNSTMSKYIASFYKGNPVSPEIKFHETRYDFFHHADSGTGKSYANMIAMDMSFLEKTYLPVLIHDLIVFSNIEDHATEEIIKEYALSKKQIFIAIDKLGRFSKDTNTLINTHEFLSLNANNLAFRQSWKNNK